MYFIIKIKRSGNFWKAPFRGITADRKEAFVFNSENLDPSLKRVLKYGRVVIIPVKTPEMFIVKPIHASWCGFERWGGPCDCGAK